MPGVELMFLLAHHEWSLPLLYGLLGGGLTAAAVWAKSWFFGHSHEHRHGDGSVHSHPHEHDHDDHEHET